MEVDGRRIVAEPLVYVALHKPRAVMCTLNDPEGRPTVADYVRRIGVRVYPVGRLDFHTSGVLLLTNDGEFSSVLQHPRKAAPKVYVAKVQGEVSDADLERWSQSIPIDGRLTQPAGVKRLRFAEGKTWLEVTLREGRNRQVRRLGEYTGFEVMRLSRQSYAGVGVEGLRPGQWRFLTADELTELKQQYGVPRRVRAAPPPPQTAQQRRVRAAAAPVKGQRGPQRGPASKFERAPSRGAERAPFKGSERSSSRGASSAVQGIGAILV